MPKYHVMMRDGTAKLIEADSLGEARAKAAHEHRRKQLMSGSGCAYIGKNGKRCGGSHSYNDHIRSLPKSEQMATHDF